MDTLLADFNALTADQLTLATLNGNVVTANAALATAQNAVSSQTTQIGADTTTVVADLQAPKYNGTAAIIPATTPVTTISLLTVVPPAVAGGQAGLAVQIVNVAS